MAITIMKTVFSIKPDMRLLGGYYIRRRADPSFTPLSIRLNVGAGSIAGVAQLDVIEPVDFAESIMVEIVSESIDVAAREIERRIDAVLRAACGIEETQTKPAEPEAPTEKRTRRSKGRKGGKIDAKINPPSGRFPNQEKRFYEICSQIWPVAQRGRRADKSWDQISETLNRSGVKTLRNRNWDGPTLYAAIRSGAQRGICLHPSHWGLDGDLPYPDFDGQEEIAYIEPIAAPAAPAKRDKVVDDYHASGLPMTYAPSSFFQSA